ncbi:MAG: tRNA pseudouridine(38-40) synthase TruA [Blastocatellia bacterium]|nr:tRNA pseudouridine(38-40) synthase TruA [Blastocatellia bacterium]
MKYRVTLAYDGTGYSGWQLQEGWPTIQGVFGEALAKLEGGYVVTHGAGRTDAGVHAEGQVVSFRLSREWEGPILRRALNASLPFEVRVMEAERASEEFHARYDAKGKTYRYRVYQAEVMNPLYVRYAWHYPYALDVERLAEAGQALIGTHDFAAFTVTASDVRTSVRTLTAFGVEREGPDIRFHFSGNGFLRYQVRTMVGALVEATRGRLKAGTVARLLESRDRMLAGAPAPARGLTLMKVEY